MIDELIDIMSDLNDYRFKDIKVYCPRYRKQSVIAACDVNYKDIRKEKRCKLHITM